MWSTRASAGRSAASCLSGFSFLLFCLCSADQRIPKLRVIRPTLSFSSTTNALIIATVHSIFSTANTSFWSFICGMSSLHPLLWVQSLRPMFLPLHPKPQIFLCISRQSSLRAPSLRGPLAALRSARLASSSFLLSSRFFFDSSALLRPGWWWRQAVQCTGKQWNS